MSIDCGPGPERPPEDEVLGHLQAFADVGFWEYDLRSHALYLSTQVFQLLGIDEPSLEAYLAVVHPDDVEHLRQVHFRARQQPGPYRVRHRTIDGERVLQIRVQSVAGAAGTPVRYLGVVSDVTAEWQLEQALEQSTSARLTGLVASGAVHDLKNIFAVVLGHTQLLTMAADGGGAPPAESLAALERAAHRGLDLTSQLLHVGHSAPVTARRVAVAPLLERIAVTATTVLGRYRRLDVDAGDGTLDLLADEPRLERVLVDLVLNARDALPSQGGSVNIAFRPLADAEVASLAAAHSLPAGAYGVIEVRDDGSGMTPDVLARVTDPFFTTKAGSGGSGVGLHTVARFVDSSGGALEIDSEPGRGSCVRIVLPARPSTSSARRRAGRARVVVCGHDEQRLAALARIVEHAGVQSVVSATATATARLLRTEPIDLLVSDALPGEDRWLLRTAAATSTPVLGISEIVGSEPSHAPLTDEALGTVVAAVERLLDRSRLDARV
jgi:PAS domain S-box-containing protein